MFKRDACGTDGSGPAVEKQSDHPAGPVGISRRNLIAALTAAPLALAGAGESIRAAELPGAAAGPLNVLCVGGHPDDPESGSAGTLARFAERGHHVTVLYLTRGERGIQGAALDAAAKTRSAECEAACQIIGAKALFAGQIDGATEVTSAWIDRLRQQVSTLAPDVLFTQWPIDTHLDHQIASLLTFRSYLSLPRRPDLYFFEVNTGSQSFGFAPNYYVDVTSVLEKKKSALLAHRSQNGDEIWRNHHGPIAQFRGREAGVTAAEAFFHLNRENPHSMLPGI